MTTLTTVTLEMLSSSSLGIESDQGKFIAVGGYEFLDADTAIFSANYKPLKLEFAEVQNNPLAYGDLYTYITEEIKLK